MSDKITAIANGIYDNVGGIQNVKKIVHCMTRVRMEIKDYSKVNITELKAVQGVMGVVEDDTLQVVVGPGTVNKVAQKMVDMAGVKLGEPMNVTSGKEKVEELAAKTKADVKKKNQKPWSKILKSISNIFVPLIPAFVGAGIIGGIASVLGNMMTAGQISGDHWATIIMVMKIVQSGVFAYLNIYVGINSANEFGASPSLGGVIGGIIMLTGVTPESPLPNIITGGNLSPNQGGIIGVIFAVFLMSIIEKKLRQVMPESIDIIVTPTIVLLIMSLVTIFLIMPVAGAISNSLVGFINWILDVGGIFAGFLLGALFLPMVMFGLHQILTPIHLDMITNTGVTELLPILAMAGAGQVGAAIALWTRCRKNTTLVELIKGALPVGVLGIGEPLIYGVTLPLGRPFITACIGGGIGGAVIGMFGNVGATSIGPSGVALIPLINNGHILQYVIGLLAGYAGGFVATYFFGTTEAMRKGQI
ncbi:permease [Vagococcus penaei]|uniref:Permease n=1 Tax=Vagococcus penaei TaxID=633807 RepID=A0A1Q2D7I3_9ENTE|nr:PTS transporter subunit EIIC [Vagococcus penaei]AQP54243.1 permease [Vagococcus penaei]RSU05871.1 permease [Vagococcus penaei]